jgi:hypothetical protein
MTTTTKFTKDGRKVAILGKLNNNETIVQEIFVADDGSEFPGGENFVVTTLLDKPAESWKEKKVRELEERYETERRRLESAIKDAQAKARLTHDRSRFWNALRKGVASLEHEQLRPLLNLIEGKVTHVLIDHSYRGGIFSIDDPELFAENRSYGRIDCDGFKALTIGMDYQKRITFRVNQYKDGSGNTDTPIYYCCSLEEAREVAQKLCDRDCEEALRRISENTREGWHPSLPTHWLEIEGVKFPPEAEKIRKARVLEAAKKKAEATKDAIAKAKKEHKEATVALEALQQRSMEKSE